MKKAEERRDVEKGNCIVKSGDYDIFACWNDGLVDCMYFYLHNGLLLMNKIRLDTSDRIFGKGDISFGNILSDKQRNKSPFLLFL